MTYQVHFEDGSVELLEAETLRDARDAVDDYDLVVTRIIALGNNPDDEDEDDLETNPEQDAEEEEEQE